MRKLAILAIFAVPVSALGAYAFAANDEAISSDSQMTVNESQKSDLSTSDRATELFAMEESGESENEAGPISSDSLRFDDAEGAEGADNDHDD
jgi:hypothetical protein